MLKYAMLIKYANSNEQIATDLGLRNVRKYAQFQQLLRFSESTFYSSNLDQGCTLL